MKLVIEIPDEYYNEMKNTSVWWSGLKKCVLNGKTLDSVLDEIKAKIEDESYLSYDDNPRHIIDESWVLEIIDKHRKESEG